MIWVYLVCYTLLFTVLWFASTYCNKETRNGSKNVVDHIKENLAITVELALSLILATVIFKAGLSYFKISVPYAGILSFLKNLAVLAVSSLAFAGLLDSKVKDIAEANNWYRAATMVILLFTGFLTAAGN
ncbi:hypothetical protein NRF22_03860 [Oenococcus kitaharae]|uniref:hypothetical protein n=1 Tax=Oenococcus TaxID=46254 RepID=UPI0021E6E4CA|nr:hypothetical protein [Oenococcus kitaharae]MCV3296249.1 hypothetical protein [Oenococcus kitaharae]